MAAAPSKAPVVRLATMATKNLVIKGPDARWRRRERGCATIPAVPDTAPQFSRIRAPE